MFERITSNSYYDIAVDSAKNRIYLTIKGFWQTKELVPHYINDIGTAVGRMKPGFTVLADLTRMVQPTPEVCALHQESQVLLVKCGAARAAQIAYDPLLTNVLNQYSAELKISRRIFGETSFAEAWLDSPGQ